MNLTTKTTQKERVTKYLLDHGSITPLDAMREFGVMRLAAVIFELRDPYGKYGYNIETQYETSKNRYGESVTYARYVLKGVAN